MSTGEKLDSIVQNLKCIQGRQAVGNFPNDFAVWNRLFENPVVDCLPVGMLLLDMDFAMRKFNSEYRKYYDYDRDSCYSPRDCIGKCYFDCFPTVSTAIVEQFKFVKATIKQHDSYQGPYTDLIDKQQSYWDAHIVPLKNRNNPTGFMLLTINVTEQVNINKLIDSKNNEIEQLETTLHTILKLKEQVNNETEDKMLANTRFVLAPLVDKLKRCLENSEYLPYIDGIELIINNLGSEFSHRLGVNGYGLTPKEIQIATLINAGKTTKEIAECLHISTDCIDFHRKNIRSKLGYTNKNTNLQTALSSLFSKTQSLHIP